MTERIFNWFVDTMARTETLDLYFMVTDLVDIPESIEQQSETALYDSMAVQTANDPPPNRKRIPLGKLVI